jgi:hypothetical protein
MNFEDIYKQALKEDEGGAANTSVSGGTNSIANAAPEKIINPNKLNEGKGQQISKEKLAATIKATEEWELNAQDEEEFNRAHTSLLNMKKTYEDLYGKYNQFLNESEKNETSNSVVVHYGDEEIDLQEATFTRLQKRKLLNEKLFEAIDTKTLKKNFDEISSLKENTFDAAKSWILYEKEEEKKGKNSPRYKIQSWTNGGGGDNSEKGQPSEYEAWRAGIVDKRRKARLEQELSDATSPFKSPTTTDVSNPTLDNQEDQFLSWWIEKHGGKK